MNTIGITNVAEKFVISIFGNLEHSDSILYPSEMTFTIGSNINDKQEIKKDMS